MEILKYPIKLKKSNDGFTGTFPTMPYGVTSGATKKEVLLNAVDCLEEIIASLMKDKKSIPHSNTNYKKLSVTLSPGFSAKVLLYNALREQHITKAELARRLHWKYPQVERLFDTHHRSQLSQLVAAASALGKVLVIGMEDLPGKC
jgi:antitoxin HicB